MSNLQSDAGDEMIKQIISIIERSNIKSVKKGYILLSALDTHQFNNLYYSSIRINTLNGLKFINQPNIPIPILNTPTGRFKEAFKLKYVNGRAAINETNNFQNQILASSFTFNINIPEDVIPSNYQEEYIVEIIIIRENQSKDPLLGPTLSDILELTTTDNQTIPPQNYVLAMNNLNSSTTYQILRRKRIHMNLGMSSFVTSINLKYTNNPELIFNNSKFVNNENPIIGNIYVAAVKRTIRNAIVIPPEPNNPKFNPEKECMKITDRLNQLDLETSVPLITMTSRHLLM